MPPAHPAGPAPMYDDNGFFDGIFWGSVKLLAHHERRGFRELWRQGQSKGGDGGASQQRPEHRAAIHGCHVLPPRKTSV
ncbi:hypothetical protein MPC4_40118 [Methylocella tundrae]|uniref:Uncharacterized protein n=1 Tax=Methylocella tundrae TaxID=227605 RepID=A0A8B6M9T9_METTU|nr:hypothetical protein MPC4_40118 [Methylocella tundrae]